MTHASEKRKFTRTRIDFYVSFTWIEYLEWSWKHFLYLYGSIVFYGHESIFLIVFLNVF